MSNPKPGEVWQLMVHPAATDGLLAFLSSRGLELVRYPGDGNDLPTYALSPSEDLKEPKQ
ncbi:hypothetical protein [Prauserella endophytica]|uniref:Glyoxalase-like domain-containing protein n=1 Tax=Prauserella endophytica TaxID=1592324 RepID=A0ABY2S2I8_9PSEU|nr:hypothetical protein [Prauserella endophytica]TKG67047.1 hypothetical protein FCN18_24385 [Prauserella endophytica]